MSMENSNFEKGLMEFEVCFIGIQVRRLGLWIGRVSSYFCISF